MPTITYQARGHGKEQEMLASIRAWIQRRQLITFILLAFGYSWAILCSLRFLPPEHAHEFKFYVPSVYGPTLAALVLCIILGGGAQLGRFLAKSLRWRLPLIWYVVSLLWIPSLLLLIRGLHTLLSPSVPVDPVQLPDSLSSLIFGFLMSLPYGPLGEEFGWRGFALPRLQVRDDALRASLVLGVIGWIWHLPQLLVPSLRWAVGNMSVFLYFLVIMPDAIFGTWLYNNSRGSLIPAILFHASMNYSIGLLAFNSPHFIPRVLAVLWSAAILVIPVFEAERMSRQAEDGWTWTEKSMAATWPNWPKWIKRADGGSSCMEVGQTKGQVEYDAKRLHSNRQCQKPSRDRQRVLRYRDGSSRTLWVLLPRTLAGGGG
jgi:membrane protease YdiL (CAAX protease family)